MVFYEVTEIDGRLGRCQGKTPQGLVIVGVTHPKIHNKISAKSTLISQLILQQPLSCLRFYTVIEVSILSIYFTPKTLDIVGFSF